MLEVVKALLITTNSSDDQWNTDYFYQGHSGSKKPSSLDKNILKIFIGLWISKFEINWSVAYYKLADRICVSLRHLNWSQSTWIYLIWLPLAWQFQNGVNQLCGSKKWRTRPTFSKKIDSKNYWNVKYFHLIDFIIYSFLFELL